MKAESTPDYMEVINILFYFVIRIKLYYDQFDIKLSLENHILYNKLNFILFFHILNIIY